jgi:hypothetical protein
VNDPSQDGDLLGQLMSEGVDADVLSEATAVEVKKAKLLPAKGMKASVRFGTLVKVQIATNRLVRMARKAPFAENTATAGLDSPVTVQPAPSIPRPVHASSEDHPAKPGDCSLPSIVPIMSELPLTSRSSSGSIDAGGALSSQSITGIKELTINQVKSSGGPSTPAHSDWLTSVAFAGSTHGLLTARKSARTDMRAIKRKALHATAAVSYLTANEDSRKLADDE